MAQTGQDALDHELRRWMRPDWRRWWKPGHENDPIYKEYERIERKFSPDQPRVPAGSREGGQWTGGQAGGSESQGSSANGSGSDSVDAHSGHSLKNRDSSLQREKARIRDAPIFAIRFWSDSNRRAVTEIHLISINA